MPKDHFDRCLEIRDRFIGTLNGIYAEAHYTSQPHSYILDRIQRKVNEPLNAIKRVPRRVHSAINGANKALLAHVFNTQLVWCHRSPDGKLYTINRAAVAAYPDLYLDANVHIYGAEDVRIPNASEEIGYKTGGWTSHHFWIGTDKEFT